MSKSTKIVIWIVVLALAIWGISSLSKKAEPVTPVGPIKIGVINVLSGPYASLGENFWKGLQLRKDEYPNLDLDIVQEDDAFEPQKGLSAYKKLVDLDRVDALIVSTSATINVIYPEVSKLSMPVLTYGSQSTDETDDNVFHIFPSSVPVVNALGEFLAKTADPNKVVSVYTNDATVLKFYQAFKNGFNQPLKEFPVNADSKDIRTTVTKVLAEKPKYIFLSGVADVDAQVVKELINLSGGSLKSKDITLVFDLTFNEATSEFEKVLGKLGVLDGSIVASLKQADASDFNAKYEKKYNDKPGQLADYGYDALEILLKTYDSDPTKWANNIKNSKLTGATGLINFDSVGRRLPIFEISAIKDGKIPDYK